jgi:hypothetical protein
MTLITLGSEDAPSNSNPHWVQSKQLGEEGGLELDLACSGMLLGGKVKIQRYFLWVSVKSGGGKMGKYQFPPASTRTMRILVPGKR